MFHAPILTTRGKEIATGLVILGLVFGGLGVGEAALRLMNLAKFGVAGTVEKSAKYHIDPASGLRAPRPGTVHGKAAISSLGFRSPEIAVPEPAGTVRLAFLGASTVFDANNGGAIEDSWPHRAVERLRARFPACTFDYVNAGVPGFGTPQVATYLEKNVARHAIDVVLVMASDFDSDATALAAARGMETNLEADRPWLARHSILFANLMKNADVLRLQRAAFSAVGHLEYDALALSAAFRERLAALVDLGHRVADGVVLMSPANKLDGGQTPEEQLAAANTALYYMPFMSVPGLVEGQAAYRQAIAEVATATGAAHVAAAESVPKDDAHYVDSAHFTVAGSEAMGEAVAAELAAEPAFLAALRANGCGG